MSKCPFNHALRPELPPLTDRIARLPVDDRGYPVPFFVSWPDGKPEFRLADAAKFTRCVREELCWVCGEKMGKYKTFTIGPMCAINRISSEPPEHKECAEWSVQGCPFLTKPQMKRRVDDFIEEQARKNPPAGVMVERNPGVSMVWTTLTFKIFPDPNRRPLFEIGEPESISFWKEGRVATREEIMESINTGLPLLEKVCQSQKEREALASATRRALKLLPA